MWPGYYGYGNPQQNPKSGLSEHSLISAAKNPDIRLDVRELFKELEKDYGAEGNGLNFGSILMPIYRDACNRIPSGHNITVSQFNEILRATGTYDFLERVATQRSAAINDIVEMAKRLSSVQ